MMMGKLLLVMFVMVLVGVCGDSGEQNQGVLSGYYFVANA